MEDNMVKSIEKNDIGAETFNVFYDSSLEGNGLGYLVISNGKKVSSVEITINNHVYDESMDVGNPSMFFLHNTISESELKNPVSYECRYFDINKNEISKNNE